MKKQSPERGFVTVATGSEHYYILAANLLKSYRLFADAPLPFAILADQENEYTALFDKVIILESPQRSYMDKVFLLNHIPYDETMFIESDILVYRDITFFFDAFSDADGFSMFGTHHPIDADITYGLSREKGKHWGWFDPNNLGKYKSQIQSIPQFGSGIIFFRKGALCDSAWQICKDVWHNASLYGLKPIDDELFAVAMAVTGCKCAPNSPQYNQCVYPQMSSKGWLPDPDMHKNRCRITRPNTGITENTFLCHWGSIYTKKALYQREAKILECKLSNSRLRELLWYGIYTLYIPLFNFWDSLNSRLKHIVKRIKRHFKF